MKKFFLYVFGALTLVVATFLVMCGMATSGTEYCGWFAFSSMATFLLGGWMFTKAEFDDKK